ncbi:glycerate kinase [Comamonas flocculans]|uniref:Glycerate kinase n=1 Tax=Comamonas flocculans TaxID=2597701 RepID=A0A5B8RW57_9BURK|nr:glycerate kinase [Comamonas flocculans]QEA12968.1 glycerate kinase [Comamonas flocculans]
MALRRFAAPLALAALIALCWRAWGWPGVLAGAGGALLWLLLHFTRLMHVMRRAAARPMGTVASAVMLHSRLRRGVNLLHVVALAQALGERLGAEGEQPERWAWRDAGGARVVCEFSAGRLTHWHIERAETGASPRGS